MEGRSGPLTVQCWGGEGLRAKSSWTCFRTARAAGETPTSEHATWRPGLVILTSKLVIVPPDLVILTSQVVILTSKLAILTSQVVILSEAKDLPVGSRFFAPLRMTAVCSE